MKIFGWDTSGNKLKNYRKKCWKPVVKDGDGDLNASKFSGIPWLHADEEWPKCGRCQRPMPLFFQLNLDQLPQELRGKFGGGLLQLFYCTNSEQMCEEETEAYFPFAKSVMVRIINPENGKTEIDIPGIENYFPEKQIIDWEELEDYPDPKELFEMGVDVDEDALQHQFPQKGDKLAGWPAWVQGIEYPKCPECAEQMQFVFQIDSRDNLPYMFGDRGRGHITQCPAHKNKVAFSWACY